LAATSDFARFRTVSPNYHITRFEGVLDISRYPEFRAEFEELLRAVPVLIDLTNAEAADSAQAKTREDSTPATLRANA